MLVLGRRRNESIVIGDDVVVTVVSIRGDKVRLGIEAPKETPVHREEVYEAIKGEAREASQKTLEGQNELRGSEDGAEGADEANPQSDEPAPGEGE